MPKSGAPGIDVGVRSRESACWGRTKVIGRFPGETGCLSLCWAALDLIITQSTRLVFTDLERQALARLRDGHSLPSPWRWWQP